MIILRLYSDDDARARLSLAHCARQREVELRGWDHRVGRTFHCAESRLRLTSIGTEVHTDDVRGNYVIATAEACDAHDAHGGQLNASPHPPQAT